MFTSKITLRLIDLRLLQNKTRFFAPGFFASRHDVIKKTTSWNSVPISFYSTRNKTRFLPSRHDVIKKTSFWNSVPISFYSTENKTSEKFYSKKYSRILVAATVISIGSVIIINKRNLLKAKEDDRKQDRKQSNVELKSNVELQGFKSFTSKEVSEHNEMSKRIWVSFGCGVYDITDFVSQHPGGDKIMMAAGGALEPFWHLFPIHKSEKTLQILENYRIGNLSPTDREVVNNETYDPFANEPRRHPALNPSSVKPFNAEPPLFLLVESFLTPNDLFFVRNHLPVPQIDLESYVLEIEGLGLKEPHSFTLQDIKNKFPKYTVTTTIQCAGNRRSELNKAKEVKGLSWGAAAISTAQWSGAKLVDVLNYCQLDFNNDKIKHVQFEGLDFDPASMPYGASVTADKALDPKGEFLLAYEMNGEELPLDHGFPIRLIAPGVVGARNVKWLKKVVLSEEESESHWQRRDYKCFSPNVDWDNVDFEKAPSIQDTPVQSVICDPFDGQKVNVDKNGCIHVRGYAWSGGGRKIIRVDVSSDEGKNWITADLQQEPTPLYRTWSWTLWKADVPVGKNLKSGQKLGIICKAVDSSYNNQPEQTQPIWNLRGVLNNAWHRINIIIN